MYAEDRIAHLREEIAKVRQQVITHPLYSLVTDLSSLRTFMEYHVYAVWDFMSLLKSLQLQLTCTTIPWYPTGDGDTRYLINEIVTGEESDIDLLGNRKSHFEMYLDAMQQAGADVFGINLFVETLKQTGDLEEAFRKAGTPLAAREFVRSTLQVAGAGKSAIQAAVFTFGREDLIPDMFLAIIEDIHHSQPESISHFKYYLERHIEVDGGHHGQLALQMVASLCGAGDQDWEEATMAAAQSLQSRISLWDGCLTEISRQKNA